jgi:carnitine 3-dehydrogenase
VPDEDLSRPVRLLAARVPADWVDYNGHVHESRYLQLFGDATDALMRFLGVDAEYLSGSGSYFTVETHLSHLSELSAGDRVEVATHLLAADEKRLHVFHTLVREGEDAPLATAEQLLLHVAADSGRAGPARADVLGRVELLASAHAALESPERAGRRVGEQRA